MIVDVKLTTDQEFKTEFMETRSAIDSNLIKPTGENGLSAYEIAVINGFSGSESEWLKSLVGPKGDKGDTGEQGPQGEKGEDGYTPVKGTDYWTSEDEASIISDLISSNEFKAKADKTDLLLKLDFKEGNGNDIDTYLDNEPTLYKITTDGTTLFNPYYLIVMKCLYSMIPGVTVKTHVQYKIASHGIYRRYYMDGVRVESYWTGWEELSPGTDTTPTEGSKKFITSGGVYEALQNQGNIISISCGYGVSAEVDPQTYVCTFNLLNANGDVISTSTIDLPLESMVVSGEYNAANKTVILTLKSGDTVEFSIADLVSGLVSQSDIVNSLDSTDATKPLSAAQGKVLNDSKTDKPAITNSTETTVSTELSDNTELIFGEVTSISVTFPASVALDYTSSIIFTTPVTLPENYSTFPSDVYFKGDECDGGIFVPNPSTRYTMLFYYDGTKIIGLVSGIEVTA